MCTLHGTEHYSRLYCPPSPINYYICELSDLHILLAPSRTMVVWLHLVTAIKKLGDEGDDMVVVCASVTV